MMWGESMCKYCDMKITEIADSAGAVFPDVVNGDDRLCIVYGNILSGRYGSRVEINFCPMCGNKVEGII